MNNNEELTDKPAGLPVDETQAQPEPVVEVTPEPTPEPVVVPEPEPTPAPAVDPEPTPAPKPKPQPKPVANHVITDADADPVYLKNCVFENKYAKKSLTVHHLQRRLAELGYNDAAGDRDGWYGELTLLAVKAFQKDNKLEATGLMDADTFSAIFVGDPNVEVVLH